MYSDGWLEQGGYTNAGVALNFLKAFRTSEYNLTALPNGGNNPSSATTLSSYYKTATYVYFTTAGNSQGIWWSARGYAA